MPSAEIHLQAAYLLLDELKPAFPQQFALGSVAPDSVNLEGFAPQSVRYEAHSRSLQLDEWKDTVRRKLCEFDSMEDFGKSFGYGVAVHLLTDIYWDEFIQPMLFEKIAPENKWQELFRYGEAVSHEAWYSRMTELLRAAQPMEYGTVSAELMGRYRDSLIDREGVRRQYSCGKADRENAVTFEMVRQTAQRVGEFIKGTAL